MSYISALMGRMTQRQSVSRWGGGMSVLVFLSLKMEMVLKIEKGSNIKTPPMILEEYVQFSIMIMILWVYALSSFCLVSHSELSMQRDVT